MRNSLYHILLAFLLVLGTACAQNAAEPRAVKGSNVTINFKNIPAEDVSNVSGQYPVNRGDGTISLPYLSGRVMVAGKTSREVEQLVRSLYINQKIYADPIVQASVMKIDDDVSARFVQVTGYVAGKKNLPYREGMTLIQALIDCGDVTDYGSRWIQITRGNVTRTYDYFSAKDRAIKLLPNDVVFVPKRPAFEGRPSKVGP